MKRFLTNHYLSSWLILLIDVFVALVSSAVSLVAIRYFGGEAISLPMAVKILLCSGSVSAVCFIAFRTHHNIIRHTSLKGLWVICTATIAKSLIYYVLLSSLPIIDWGFKKIFLAVLLDFLLTSVFLVGVRVIMLVVYDWMIARYTNRTRLVLVYGVGDKSVAIKTRLHKSPHYRVVGFLNAGTSSALRVSEKKVYNFSSDEDLAKIFSRSGATAVVFAGREDVMAEREGLIAYCTDNRIKTFVTPQVDEFDGVNVDKNKIREIRIEDLLGREEIQINQAEIYEAFHDKVVMVTGGAGSIGSEICRQMAELKVRKLIIFDCAETPLHEIRLELEKKYPSLDLVPFIGDVRSQTRLQVVFDRHNPQIVFHAAAYKHVPLMEENPCEAVMSNVMGSRFVAEACVRNGVEKVVMISTDKAVNPTNVMGCSKRIAEIYCQSLGMAIAAGSIEGKTKFVTTRFGNVLGSNGSVIPYFRKQIEAGGPVTVTHPEINRFFMTIPEACRLVMEAATMSDGNEIYVFEMGKAVKIVDLATRMIKLAGLTPGEDIKIEFTGLRPGEKLYEEVLSNEENTIPTDHHKIKIAKVREYDYGEVQKAFDVLIATAAEGDVFDTVRKMKQLVPEFKSNNSEFEQLDKELEKSNLIA